jgi:hypothetical protein
VAEINLRSLSPGERKDDSQSSAKGGSGVRVCLRSVGKLLCRDLKHDGGTWHSAWHWDPKHTRIEMGEAGECRVGLPGRVSPRFFFGCR